MPIAIITYLSIKLLEVLYNEAEQACAALAYYKYVKQTSVVPTKLDSAYNSFIKKAG